MVYLTSTYTDQLNQSIADALGALFGLAAIMLIIRLGLFILMIALITWIVKKVWYAGSNREYKRQKRQHRKMQKEWDQYRRDQEKHNKNQEFEEFRLKQSKKDKSFENNPDWKWDEKNQLWRYKSQWDKIEE